MTRRFDPLGFPLGGPYEFPHVVMNMRDFEGKSPMATIFGEQQVGFKVDDISVQFQYNNSTKDVTTTTTGTGTVGNVDSEVELKTGTGVGLAEVTSVDSIRYRPGHEMVAMFTTHYGVPEAGVNMYHGVLNDDNGVAFGYEDTDFGVYFESDGVPDFVPQSQWNIDKLDGTGRSRHKLDPNTLNIYKISYGWLGIAPIMFSVYAGYIKGWVLCHVIDLVNSQDGPHLKNPTLPIRMRIERASGTGADVHMHSSSWRAGVVAGMEENNSSNRWFGLAIRRAMGSVSYTGANYANVLSLRSNSTFQSKINHVLSELRIVTFDNQTGQSVEFVGIVNGTLTGNTAFTNVDATNSVMSLSTGGSVSGIPGPATILAPGSDRRTDVSNTGIYFRPGDVFTFGARKLGGGVVAGDVGVSPRWPEYF